MQQESIDCYNSLVISKYPLLENKITNTGKLFYKKYPHKIMFVIPQTRNNMSIFQHNIFLTADSFFKNYLDLESLRTYKYFYNKSLYISVYLENIYDILKLIDLCNSKKWRIKEVAIAKSNIAAEYMGNNKKVLIRDSLYFKRYRYRVEFRVNYQERREHINSMNGFFQWNLFEKNNPIWLRVNYNKFTLFIENKDDLMLFLLYNNNKVNITEIKLHKELQE